MAQVPFHPTAIIHLLKSHGIPIAKYEKVNRVWTKESGVSVKTMPMTNGKKAIIFEVPMWAHESGHPDTEKERKELEQKVLHILHQNGFIAEEPVHGSGLWRIGTKKV